MIVVEKLKSQDIANWEILVRSSLAGTLFHNLNFLQYHPHGKHNFNHLVMRDDAGIIAVIPGGLIEGPDGIVFRSPVGASIGGFVPGRECSLDLATRLVKAFINHGRSSGWAKAEIVLPPPVYNGALASLFSFALSQSGFTLANRSACFLLQIQPRRAGGYAGFFRSRMARYCRAAQRRGAHVIRTSGSELLGRFKPLFDQTYARHGTMPTHSFEELTWLAEQFPDRFTVHLTEQAGIPIGGTCLMSLNDRVTIAMYTCTSDSHIKDNGVIVAIADAIEMLSEKGVQWYDLGPSADHFSINAGVVTFKEGLGGEIHLREIWTKNLS